jgi:hypothetical protein
MDKQFDSVKELDLSAEVLRDLLATEIMLIGGGEAAGSDY